MRKWCTNRLEKASGSVSASRGGGVGGRGWGTMVRVEEILVEFESETSLIFSLNA